MVRAATFVADIALLVGIPGPGPVRAPEPYVPPLGDVQDVLRVLQAPKARNNPPYVLSVLKSYVRPRVARRRSKLQDDILYLASECPEFASEFRAILKHYRLPLPPELLSYSLHPAYPTYHSTYPSSTYTYPSPYGQYNAINSPYHTLPRRQRSSRSNIVHRVMSPSADPPPPYASEDPDPNTTAIQALRLAAQSRIALGDLAALAQRSRADVAGIAERSQADLTRLAEEEEEARTRAAALMARREALRRLEGTPPPRPPRAAAREAARLRAERRCAPPPSASPRPPRSTVSSAARDRSSVSSFTSLAARRLSQLRAGFQPSPHPNSFRSSRSSRRPASIATPPMASMANTPPPSPARHRFSLQAAPMLPPLAPLVDLSIDFDREFENLWDRHSWGRARFERAEVGLGLGLNLDVDVETASVIATEG